MLRKILTVDDSALIHKMYRFFLKRYRGCVVVSASNGREALDKLATETDVDLILLDINMPIMNGIQFLQDDRRLKEYGSIPVIVISTEGKEEDTIRGLELGAKAYLVKPFNAVDLQVLINEVLLKHANTGATTVKESANGTV